MFKKNEKHEQGNLFNPEDEYDSRIKKMLTESWSNIFYENIFSEIDESIFKDLYSDKEGRSNFPVNILVSLEILKELFSLTDEQLIERYHFDLLMRRSMGLTSINDHILSPRTLYYFRSSLVEYELKTGSDLLLQVFKKFRDNIISELGIKTGLQRTDSTLIEANIKKMNRLMLFHKVLSNYAVDLHKLNIDIPSEINAILKKDEDNFVYRLAKEEVTIKISEIGGYLYELVILHEEDSNVTELKSYKDAKRLLEEHYTVSKNKLNLKSNKELDSSSMQNPSDTEATYRKKNNKEHRGYAAHATETCDRENKIQVITDIDVVPNNIDDAKVLKDKISELREETGLQTIITDATFYSEDVLHECIENGIDLVPTKMRGQPSKDTTEKRLDSKDFSIDKTTNKIIACPNGVSPRSQTANEDSVTAYFDRKICMQCDKHNACIACGKRASSITIDMKRKWIDERYKLLKTEAYKEILKLRPPVEGLMSMIKPKYLSGRILFRGLKKVRNRMILKAISINFRRYDNYWLNFIQNLCIMFQMIIKNILKWRYQTMILQ